VADVLISLDDKTEKMLRELAREKYGGKKGSLSEAATDAISSLYASSGEAKRQESLAELVKIMKKGIDLGLKGKPPYVKREELYESRFKNFD